MNKSSGNIVYLYSEVMPYVIIIMEALRDNFHVNIHCVSWDENKKTPFTPQNQEGITFYKRSSFDEHTLKHFVDELSPSIICISGRMDKAYLKTVLYFREKHVPVITFCDNQWFGTIKNRIGAIFGNYLYRRYFNYIIVAGRRQYEFAKRVGYDNSHIINNMLTADVALFKSSYSKRRQNTTTYPHTIAYVGRFAEVKGIDLLIEAFADINKELNAGWKLILVGSGDKQFGFNADSGIEIKGFMSAEELAADCIHWGVFCLPSNFEPYGVVVHEFAAAGLPLICSDSVGAADTFVIEGYNGYMFKSGNKESLKNKLRQIMSKTNTELWEMGDRSSELSSFITPQKCAYYIMSVLSKESKT